jgi:hypothetical protein
MHTYTAVIPPPTHTHTHSLSLSLCVCLLQQMKPFESFRIIFFCSFGKLVLTWSARYPPDCPESFAKLRDTLLQRDLLIHTLRPCQKLHSITVHAHVSCVFMSRVSQSVSQCQPFVSSAKKGSKVQRKKERGNKAKQSKGHILSSSYPYHTDMLTMS